MRKNFDLDDTLMTQASELIENTRPKYRSLSHFIEVAVTNQIELDHKETSKRSTHGQGS